MDINNILNISKTDVEKTIQESISHVLKELSGLDTERTCKIYTSYILQELRKHHILAHLINAKELGSDYEHYFVLAKDGMNDFLIDLTYNQFGWTEPESLINNGYIKLSTNDLKEYLYKISKLKTHNI